MKPLCPFGTHRVIEPKGVLPQAAEKIDATPICYDNEIMIDVDVLNIDSASFHQIKEACQEDESRMKAMIEKIIQDKGKMQNPVTKSGGMLIGRIDEIGKNYPQSDLRVGDAIATLVSLSLTPLHLEEIISINMDNEQVKIRGKAILFESGILEVIPQDLDERLVLAGLDVCGAPAQIKHLAKENDTVFIIGAAGKSGLLCAYQAKINVGPKGRVIGLVNEETQRAELDQLNVCDDILLMDARDGLGVYNKIKEITGGKLCDLSINVVNVPDTEMTTILATKDRGIVYFFSMATSFTKAALGAEGVKKDVTMMIGNGYTKDHAKITLDILRNHQGLKNVFNARYVGGEKS